MRAMKRKNIGSNIVIVYMEERQRPCQKRVRRASEEGGKKGGTPFFSTRCLKEEDPHRQKKEKGKKCQRVHLGIGEDEKLRSRTEGLIPDHPIITRINKEKKLRCV